MQLLTRAANRLLYRLTAGLPCRRIEVNSRPYLERYYVGELLGVTFYLHRFVSNDSERHVHNHPWRRGCSFILSGAYTEEIAVDVCPIAGTDSGCLTMFKRRRWFNWVGGSTFHRIHNAAPGTWTLFCHGERERVGPQRRLKGWGFFSTALLNTDAATVFRPYAGSNGFRHTQWWNSAPAGRDVGRVPL